MTYATSNSRSRLIQAAEYWTSQYAEVVAFGRDLLRGGILEDADDLQEYYEKPHHWNSEYAWWDSHGRPDTVEAWYEYDPYTE